MTTVSVAQRSTKLDPAKLRLFSIPRKAVPGGAATVSGGTTPLSGATSASRGNSADPRISRTNTATSQLGSTGAAAASRVASRDAYSREGSRASALTKRSLSSEDARRIMKDRMSRPPDIAPVRGGNINIDNVTPEYVTEFWTRKKMESDEFKRRRLELNSAKKHALASVQVLNHSTAPKESSDPTAAHPAGEGKSSTATVRQPLRVARPATLKPATAGATTAPAASTGKSDVAKSKLATTKPTATGTSPTRTTSPSQQTAAAKRPVVRTSSAGGVPRATPVQSVGKGLVRSASATSPAPSQPVARRLLVGSALGKAQRSVSPPQLQPQESQPVVAEAAQLQPAARTPSSTSLPKQRPTSATIRPSTAASTRSSTASASSPPKGILTSGKGPASRGPSPSGPQRRVHIDPAVAEGKKAAPEVEGLEAVF